MPRNERDRLRFARRVTRHHGAIFGTRCRDLAMCEELYEAFEATAVMAWPDGALEDHAAQLRYHDIAQEILTRILEAVQDAMGVAFVDVAREVIERERKVQRRGKPKR